MTSDFYIAVPKDDDSFAHHGTKGQKWGVRQYQNPDGSLTELGRKHYGYGKVEKRTDRSEKIRAKADKYAAEGNIEKAESLYRKASRMDKRTAKMEAAAEAKRKADYKAYQDEKERVVKTGDMNQLLANAEHFTEQEFNDAIKRITQMTTVKDLKAQRNRQTLNNANEFLKSAGNVLNAGVALFNSYEKSAEVINTITGKDTLPIFTKKPDKGGLSSSDFNDLLTKGTEEINKNFNKLNPEQAETARKFVENSEKVRKAAKQKSSDASKEKEANEKAKEQEEKDSAKRQQEENDRAWEDLLNRARRENEESERRSFAARKQANDDDKREQRSKLNSEEQERWDEIQRENRRNNSTRQDRDPDRYKQDEKYAKEHPEDLRKKHWYQAQMAKDPDWSRNHPDDYEEYKRNYAWIPDP